MRMVNLCKNKLFNTGLMLFLCLGLQAQNKEMRRVATNDCGVTNTQAVFTTDYYSIFYR